MALPAAPNQLSFSDFNTDRGISATAEINIEVAANAYDIPDRPHGMDEFRGRSVPSAPPPPPPPPPPPSLNSFMLGFDLSVGQTACGALMNQFFSSCSTLGIGCFLKTDSSGVNNAADGYYSDGVNIYYVEGGGFINSAIPCGSTSPPPPPPPPTPSMKSFTSSNNTTLENVCFLTTSNTFYFVGTGLYPQIGDVCYGNIGLTRVLLSGYYLMDNGYYIQIGTNGLVIDNQQCTI